MKWMLAASAVAAATPAPDALAADAYPCGAAVSKPWSERPVQPCPLTSPEANGWIPVYTNPVPRARGAALPKPAGWLHGTPGQYFVCQARHASALHYHQRGWRNVWWAYTKSDDGIWGWVPEVYFRGGNDDEADRGLRTCDGSPVIKPVEDDRGPGGGGTPKRRCEDIRDQRVTVDFNLARRVTVSGGRGPGLRQSKLKRFGQLTIEPSACQKSRRRWTVDRVFVHRALSSELTVTVQLDRKAKLRVAKEDTEWGAPFRRGWGVELTRSKVTGAIAVQGLHCVVRPPWWEGIPKLLSLPLPVNYPTSVVQYELSELAEALIPEPRADCGKKGIETLRLSADRFGCVRVSANGGMQGSYKKSLRLADGSKRAKHLHERILGPIVSYHGSCRRSRVPQRPGRQP